MTLAQIKADVAELKAKIAEFVSGKVSATSEALTQFQSRFTLLETSVNTELTQAQSDLANANQTISGLNEKLTTATDQVNAKGTEIENLKASHATALEAEKKRTNETLAKMGIEPERIPASPAGGAEVGIVEQYEKITNPRDKAEFRRKNYTALFRATRK